MLGLPLSYLQSCKLLGTFCKQNPSRHALCTMCRRIWRTRGTAASLASTRSFRKTAIRWHTTSGGAYGKSTSSSQACGPTPSGGRTTSTMASCGTLTTTAQMSYRCDAALPLFFDTCWFRDTGCFKGFCQLAASRSVTLNTEVYDVSPSMTGTKACSRI